MTTTNQTERTAQVLIGLKVSTPEGRGGVVGYRYGGQEVLVDLDEGGSVWVALTAIKATCPACGESSEINPHTGCCDPCSEAAYDRYCPR